MAHSLTRRLMCLCSTAMLTALIGINGLAQSESLKPGNILFFNRYTSDSGNPKNHDTQINITNVSKTTEVTLHLFLVENGTNNVADSFLTLTPAQTVSFLAGEFDPDVRGRLYAVAVNKTTWEAVTVNSLIGTAYIREPSGSFTTLVASTLSSLPPEIAQHQPTPPPPNQQPICVGCVKPGSVLFIGRYASHPTNPALGDTRISISGGSSSTGVSIHVFLVDGASCGIADFYLDDGGSFLASQVDPGIEGYVVAVAVDDTGAPTQSNTLSGSAAIRESDGRMATLPGVAFAKLSPGSTAVTDSTAELLFNGSDYERLPNSLALAGFNSQTTDTTFLSLYSPTSNLIVGAPQTANVFALLYNDVEIPLSSSFPLTCYRNNSLQTLFNRQGVINRHVPVERTGWIHLSSNGRPLLGAAISKGPVFNGGHNLHILGSLPSYSIRVPVY